MTRSKSSLVVAWVVVCGWTAAAVAPALFADESTATGKSAGSDFTHFEARIRPVLARHCDKCHSAKTSAPEGGLRLDSREAIRKGGDRGPAVVPGQPEASLLLSAIRHSDPDLQMPPKSKKLPDAVIEDFEIWIRAGAPDPRETASTGTSPAVDLEKARQFWAYQKPVEHPAPEVSDAAWPNSEIDRFVLKALESSGLKPSADAEPLVLLRRLHFVLVGLPPSPQAMKTFASRIDQSGLDTALAGETDRLLQSPQFGERWGRHWLDVARFAESSGKEANISFPYAWRYRDYVIDSFQSDEPFDRFITEQIAGDLLPYESAAERAKLLIATGYLAVGAKNLDEGNALQFQADLIDEQIDATSRGMLANSIACARCHDHKFDPFSMEDYYSLAGVFASTKTYFGTWTSPANQVGGDPLVLPRDASLPVFHDSIPEKRVAELKAQRAALKKEEEDGRKAVWKAVAEGRDASNIFTLRDALRIFWQSGGIEGQLEKVDEHGQALPLAMGVLDRDRMIDVPLLERGEIARPGQTMPRRFPGVVQLTSAPAIPAAQSGRLEFARWLTHADNPLTARVMVNRVWQHVFGAGLVRTTDNFGMTGEPPSHPQLLDSLAVRFQRDGWSVKSLIRSLVLSRTFRQSSDYRESAFPADPENRLLWRMSKRRLDAEAIRDAMLFASGELDTVRPAGSLVAKLIGDRPISLIGLDSRVPADLDHSVHRSVYLPVLRDRLPDVLDLFDFAEPSLVTGSREVTNVPVQALYLMNSSFVVSRARAMAKRITHEADSMENQVLLAFELCFGRHPDVGEATAASGFLIANNPPAERDKAGDPRNPAAKTSPPNDTTTLSTLAAFCQALIATAEFRNLD